MLKEYQMEKKDQDGEAGQEIEFLAKKNWNVCSMLEKNMKVKLNGSPNPFKAYSLAWALLLIRRKNRSE